MEDVPVSPQPYKEPQGTRRRGWLAWKWPGNFGNIGVNSGFLPCGRSSSFLGSRFQKRKVYVFLEGQL